MSNPGTNYFETLGNGVAGLISSILDEPGLLFRRSRQVVFGPLTSANRQDYSLRIVSQSGMDTSSGTFNTKTSDDRFLVFRSPVKLTVGFSLLADGMGGAANMKAYDKLYSYFFDHKTIEPYLPESVRTQGALYEKLSSFKAELKVRPAAEDASKSGLDADVFRFDFDYTALYHSGNPLREEFKAKTRVFDFTNEERNAQ